MTASIKDKLLLLSESVAKSLTSASCEEAVGEDAADAAACRDDALAQQLKLFAIGVILVAGVCGVSIPLAGRKRRWLRTDGAAFVLAKAFAAGVILATGFVHMLHDAEEALTSPCLPASPWRQFPFPGFVAMLAALMTLVFDFLATQFYERKHREDTASVKAEAAAVVAGGASASQSEDGITVVDVDVAVAVQDVDEQKMPLLQGHGHAHGHGHGHAHGHEVVEEGQVPQQVRHVVVSQILELGIVSHSVIIGLSLGVSRSPCTIRTLVAALAFHQFFEGFALGGCISQAQFKNLKSVVMASFFAITTPSGIAIGAGMASFYYASSPRAMVVEGLLDSVSAGILIYMALVDLIAADFLSGKLTGNLRLQVASYVALFLGALSMSSLAIWA